MSEPQHLALYESPMCSYCRKVRGFLEQIGEEVEGRDVMGDPENFDELIAATGRTTVPCLRIESTDGEVRWMHESADIIDWLRDYFAKA
ncbi:MAG: glutaredoxin [Myxococcota bacterium]|nr:glutaredoxin [Myxococcota bacterium]